MRTNHGMLNLMKTLPELILGITHKLSEGEILTPSRFLHLTSRSAVYRELCRLVADEKLLRIGRGLYVATVVTPFGVRTPTTKKVVCSLANALGETITDTGARSANKLGLSTQVPVHDVFLSTGRSRKLQIGKTIVSIQHAPQWLMALGPTKAGDAVRALDWLGPLCADETVKKLRKLLPENEWSILVSAHGSFPTWMRNAIRAHIGHT